MFAARVAVRGLLRSKVAMGVGIGAGVALMARNPIRNDNLIPLPADTYENGLFMASQNELKQQKTSQRDTQLKKFYILNKIKFFIIDYLIEPIITISRFFELTLIFSPILILTPISYFKNGSLVWYKVIKWSLENAGASFIKLGQWAASRTDIFPSEFCNELSTLHSNAKSHSFSYTKKVIEETFGLSFDKIFKSFNKDPIGVGAIAQVYLGEFNDDIKPELNNKKVAIKIIHPNVTETIKRDIKIMKFFAYSIDILPTMEWLSLPSEVLNFEILMNLQLDLRIESLNLMKFDQNFKNNLFINFPKPYYSNRNLLVEEFINGISMSTFLELNKSNDNEIFKRISDDMIDSFLQMLILNNFIHSDLHPGNIFIRFIKTNEMRNELKSTPKETDDLIKDIKATDDDKLIHKLHKLYQDGYQPEICYIDAGLVTELNETNRVNFIALFNALAEFDGYKAGELMIERSKTPETAIDSEIFALKVERLVDKIKQRTFTLGTVSIGDLLEKMLSMVRVHHVRMEGDFITVIVAILLIEGIGRQLDPDLDLFARFVYFGFINGIPLT